MRRIILFFLFLICIFSFSGAKEYKSVEKLLISLGQISADLIFYQKKGKFEIVSIGKDNNIYSFILKKGKPLLFVSGSIPVVSRYTVYLGDYVFSLKKGKVIDKKTEENLDIFSLKQKDGYWYLYLKQGKKEKLRFKSKEKPVLVSGKKIYFMVLKKNKKVEVYYLKAPKYFPRIIKRLPLFSENIEILKCGSKIYIFQIPQKPESSAFLFTFDTKTKRLIEKLRIKKWNYSVVGCGVDGILLSSNNRIILLSKDGRITNLPKVSVSLRPKKPESTKLHIDDIQGLWLFKEFFIVNSQDTFSLFSKELDKKSDITLPVKNLEFFSVSTDLFAVEKEKNKICVYKILESKAEKLFCKKFNHPEFEYKLTKQGVLIFDRLKRTFFRYSLDGNLLVKEKLPSNIKTYRLTKYGLFYVESVLVRLKPDGDFEIYEIKPSDIRAVDNYTFFITERGNYFFNGNKLVSLGVNCEPFENAKLCYKDGIYRIFSLYPKKLLYTFIERPVCKAGDYFVFYENIKNEAVLKLYSGKERRLKFYFPLEQDVRGFKCWNDEILIIHKNEIEFIYPRR